MMRSLFFSALLVFLPLLSTNTFAMSVNSQVSRGADSGSAVQLPDDSFAIAGFMARRAPEPDGRGASSAAGHQHESVRERDSTAGSSMADDQHD
ncbi:hypothetical protein A0H81_00177 [Grifola frondosa]|uniref:Uncharacterized protein n=1 Tax=Grifola frondosa TaxID=5627 RepID=A0A1C7MR08_GRIFR|nr:hypothetical protein A0H81_00177 [Grifola frondosa]